MKFIYWFFENVKSLRCFVYVYETTIFNGYRQPFDPDKGTRYIHIWCFCIYVDTYMINNLCWTNNLLIIFWARSMLPTVALMVQTVNISLEVEDKKVGEIDLRC